MGVRGASRREQKPRQKLGKSVMKPYSPVQDPPSTSSPPTSPTPPPSLVPEPDTRPRLRDDIPPIRAAELQAIHHTQAQPSARNLLISPVKANRARNARPVLRPPSSRIAQNAQKQLEQDQEAAEEAFTVEFRVYPFPPTTRPLCYPLNQVPDPTGTHAESDSLPGMRKEAVRKMLLKRWHDDLAAKERAEIGSTTRETPSDASQRRLGDSPRVTRKRGRSPPPAEESDDEAPMIQTMSGVAHAMASAPFNLDEGDPVLPMIGARSAFEVRSNGTNMRVARGDSTEFGRVDSQEKFSKYTRVGERGMVKRTPGQFSPHTAEHSSLPSSLRASENERNSGKTVEDGFPGGTGFGKENDGAQEASSDEVHSKPTEDALRELRTKIHTLRHQRKSLERKKLDEISVEAARNGSLTATKEDRVRLKREIEGLSSKGVQDLLRLMSRRMEGLKLEPKAEIKVQLDAMPANLTKEMRLMVLLEKGQLALPASNELRRVRAELREVVRQYRRHQKLVGA